MMQRNILNNHSPKLPCISATADSSKTRTTSSDNFNLLKSFFANKSGGVAIFAAVSVTAVIGIVGVGIDYARAVAIRTSLQAAADAAALAAAKDPTLTDAGVTELASAMVTANLKGDTLRQMQPSVTTTRLSGAVSPTINSITVRVSANMPSSIMGAFGVRSTPIGASATAAVGMEYTAVYAAIDMSASFSLGADATQRAAIQALTKPYLTGTRLVRSPNGCEFACHSREGWEPVGITTYQMAKNAGIILREDNLNAAFNTFVDAFFSPSEPTVIAGRRQMSVLGFSKDAMLLQSTTNSPTAIKAASANFPDAQRDTTDFGVVMATLQSQIGTPGDGSSALSPKKTLLLITDGMEERIRGDVTTIRAIDTNLCTKIKKTGISIAVLEVQYLSEPGDYYFDLKVAPVYSTFSPALKNCASPGMHFIATDSEAKLLAAAFSQTGNALNTKVALTK